MYVNYYRKKTEELAEPVSAKELKYLEGFRQHLNEGIAYYKNLFRNLVMKTEGFQSRVLAELEVLETELNEMELSRV